MNDQLLQAVQQRINLEYTKEQITAELQQAGYDDEVIEATFAVVNQANSAASLPQSPIIEASTGKKTISPWMIAFAPIIFFIGIIVLWGVLNLFAQSSGSNSFDSINNTVIPLLMGLTFIAMPICIIWAIVAAFTRYDGIIRCGNCSYNGPGKPGRSLWAQIAAWIAFFFFWPITLVYYLATHRYQCPQCQSTFVGMRDKHGHYSSASSGMGGAAVIILCIVLIAVVGILAAVVLGSLNDARDRGMEAAERQRAVQGYNIPVVPTSN